MKLNIHSIVLGFLLAFSFNTYSQWDTTWTKTYGGNRDDKSFDIIKTNDDGFLVIGSTSSFGFDNSQMYFLKLDSTGAIVWSKSHGGHNQESGHSVIQTADGGFLGVGYTNSWGAGGFDMFLVKLDVNGNLEYEDYYGGTNWDFAWDVVETSPNKFVIAGETQSFGAGSADAWLIKYNGNTQTIEWDKTIGLATYENFKALAKGENGTLLAVGKGIQSGRTDEDVFITRFDSLGDTLWTNYYGDTLQDYANDVIWMSDGKYSLTGSKTILDTSLIHILQIDKSGSIIFEDRWGKGQKKAYGSQIFEMSPNRVSVLGTYEYANGNTDFKLGYSYFSNGVHAGGTTMGSPDQEYSEAGAYLGVQGYALVGNTNGYSSTFTNIIIFKTDQYGFRYDDSSYDQITDTFNITDIRDNKISKNEYWSYLRNSNTIFLKQVPQNSTILFYTLSGQLSLKLKINSYTQIRINTLPISKGAYVVKIQNPKSIDFNAFLISKN